MERSIQTWRDCDPYAMAFQQSQSAIYYAIADAREDILKLAAERDELLAALVAIYAETMPFSPVKPHSADSYLPPHLVEMARVAIARVNSAAIPKPNMECAGDGQTGG